MRYYVNKYDYNKNDIKAVDDFFEKILPADINDIIQSYITPNTKSDTDYWHWAEFEQQQKNEMKYKQINEVENLINKSKAKDWKIGFGKYKGRPYRIIDTNYRIWLIEKQVIKNEDVLKLFKLLNTLNCLEKIRESVNYD